MTAPNDPTTEISLRDVYQMVLEQKTAITEMRTTMRIWTSVLLPLGGILCSSLVGIIVGAFVLH